MLIADRIFILIPEAVRVEEGPAVFKCGPGAPSWLGSGVNRRLQSADGLGCLDPAFREAKREENLESFLTLGRLGERPAEILDSCRVSAAGQGP